MLSILIPVFNFHISDLVSELYSQAAKCNIPFQILCIDDASASEFKTLNRTVANLPHVKYIELPANIGRSKIRNLLASEAIYEQLLFLDCDSKITDPKFVSRYIDNARKDTVVYGGRNYSAEPPADRDKYLRWLYGVTRETIPVEHRKKHPYKSFMTNNFLIPASVFQSVKFNEELVGYGHEDTLFGNELNKNNVPVLHIDNALCHIGLESPEDFLAKTEQGLRNLCFVISTKQNVGNVKLLDYYKLLNRLKIGVLVKVMWKLFRKKIKANLVSESPGLLLFDLYKLGYLFSLDSRK